MKDYIDGNGKRWKDKAEYEYFRKRAPVPPTETRDDTPMGGTILEHPAFGQIQASRVSGTAVLFGSEFAHGGFVSVKVTRSRMHRSLSRDWVNPTSEIVEVWLSEAQWASFVSTLNYGTGVPCTINHLQHEVVPAIRPAASKTEQFKAEASEHLVEAEALVAKLQALLDEGKLKPKQEVQGLLWQLKNNLTGGVNFVAKQFGEHVETVMEHAKLETEAYVSGVLQRAGAQALVDSGQLPRLLAPDGKDGER